MRAILLGLAAVSCASPGTPRATSREPDHPITIAGDRCPGGTCTCRAVDDYGRGGQSDETAVAAGQKRFELRTGRGLFDVSVTVEGRGTLAKNKELPDPACAYLDLPPGRHHVKLHAVAAEEAGMVPALFINEWSGRTHDWYQVFQFRCGGNETCSKDELQRWNDTEGKKPRGIYDPCGSVQVEQLHWQVAHSPDVKVEELEMELVLHVYKFTPRFLHGNKSCKGVGGVDVEDEPKPLPQ